MRLWNNMTTMESCDSLSNVCPRKCRPPRIGDIPKHGAVDQESPSSSSREQTTPPPSGDTTGPDGPAGSRHPGNEEQVFTGFPGGGGEAPAAGVPPDSSPRHLSSSAGKETTRRRTEKDGVLVDREYSVAELIEELDRVRDIEDARVRTWVNGLLRDLFDKSPRSSPSAEPTEEEFQPILEVRKDSALYLEESEVLPSLREVLKSRGPRIVRPRRESSGYASIISTFDDDRRGSCCADVLQDIAAFTRDRRRSSARRSNSRILLEESPEATLPERMPTTEVHRKVSGAGLEMPNIEVVKEDFENDSPATQSGLARTSLSPELNTEEPNERESSATSSRCSSSVSEDYVDLIKEINGVLSISYQQPLRNILRKPRRSPNRECSAELASIVEKPAGKSACLPESSRIDNLVQVNARESSEEILKVVLSPDYASSGSSVNEVGSNVTGDSGSSLAKSVKVYQLLSTQSEDRGDGELSCSGERRVSLEITRGEIKSTSPRGSPVDRPSVLSVEDSAPTQLARSPVGIQEPGVAPRKLSSPEASERFLGEDSGAVNVRPIYPYCLYSPYASPQGSPRNRRRPLRESRRVSIDNRQGAIQLNQYKLLDNIGQGSYGIVKLAYNELDKTHYAMKILSKKKLMKKAGIFGRMAPGRKGAASPLAKVYREIALLKKLDHPNVVKLVEVLDDPDEDHLYLVFELVQKGEILQVPTDKPLDEETARINFRDVVMGVEYLHYQRIVHRDIKPSNLLVDREGRIKIADLGVSAELRASGELLSGAAGTPAFAAPETTNPGAHYSGTLCDVWSMGVTLYSLVTGRVPWDGAGSIVGVQAAVRTEPLKFPETPELSEDLRALIGRMLAKDSAERITLPRIKEDPWLTRRGAEPLPSEADNCRLPVTVTDEEVERVITRAPKLDTLILIKTMLKQHSFQNPFMPKRSGRTSGTEAEPGSPQIPPARKTNESLSRQDTAANKNTKTEQFQRAGRSNSAPDSYNWQTNGRQISIESSLPPVSEVTGHEFEAVRR